jgi:hypothetical protein
MVTEALVRIDYNVSHSGAQITRCGMSFISSSRRSQVSHTRGQGVTDWNSFTRSYRGPLAKMMMLMQQKRKLVVAGCIKLACSLLFLRALVATTSPAVGARAKRALTNDRVCPCAPPQMRGELFPVLEMLRLWCVSGCRSRTIRKEWIQTLVYRACVHLLSNFTFYES